MPKGTPFNGATLKVANPNKREQIHSDLLLVTALDVRGMILQFYKPTSNKDI